MGGNNGQPRPRPYDPCPWQWAFHQIPPTVEGDKPNPARDSAIFVVHGMGEQAYTDTAVELRDGMENIIDRFGRSRGQTGVPAPYILDGYWANYSDFESTFPADSGLMSVGERTFFSRLWQRRGTSPGYAYHWFLKQGWRLLSSPTLPATYTWADRLKSVPVVIAAWIGVVLMRLRYRDILARVLGDVSLYVSPNGAVNGAIVQNIERRVGEKFLLLLGLDWDLRTLPHNRQLRICGRPHSFQYVVWVAHSLGTVVSYNVICALFERMQQIEKKLQDAKCPWSPSERDELRQNLAKLRRGLHRFVTIGSPLQKFAVLFPEALSPLPEKLRQRLESSDATPSTTEAKRHWWVNFLDWLMGPKRPQAASGQAKGRWWVNFFHAWDPVSGRLLDRGHFPQVENKHSRLWRWPLLAHTSYWRDNAIQTYILSRTYGRDIFLLPPQQDPRFLSESAVSLLRWVNALVSLSLLALLVWLLVQVVVFPGETWATLQTAASYVWQFVKWWWSL